MKILPAAAFEAVRTEPEGFIEAGEHVITPVIGHFRGRDGIEVTLYQERHEALEAAGLGE